MALGDFLQGAGRASRASAIGALKGRRQALDRKEEERKQKDLERRADVQNQLMQQLRDVQSSDLQLRIDAQSDRDATNAASAGEFRSRFPDISGDLTDLQVIEKGEFLQSESDQKDERENKAAVASALATAREAVANIQSRGTGTGRTEEQRIAAESVASRTRLVISTLAGVNRIFAGTGEGVDEFGRPRTPAQRGQAAHALVVRSGFSGIPALMDEAAAIGAPPAAAAAAAAPAGDSGGQGQRSAQELWDAVANENGGPEAALRILGVPRPAN